MLSWEGLGQPLASSAEVGDDKVAGQMYGWPARTLRGLGVKIGGVCWPPGKVSELFKYSWRAGLGRSEEKQGPRWLFHALGREVV